MKLRLTKKRIIILVSILLGLALLAGGTFAYIYTAKPFHTGDLTGAAEKYAAQGGTVAGREIQPLSLRESGNLVILQFNDTHFVTADGKDEKTLAAMEEELMSHSPDLVVINGDMLDGFNSKMKTDKRGALCAVADLFERHDQYWAYVPGNNDGEYLGSTEDVAAFLAQSYPHCLLSNEEDLTGATQFVIPVQDAEGQTVHALVFMDSLARDPETNYLTYSCMKKDQADWLRGQLTALKTQAPQAKASIFFHMNTPAFTQAKNEGEAYSDDYAMPDFPDSWSIRGNDIIDSAISAAGNVGLVSIGHLHPAVNWCAFYQGRYYHITRASGYQVTRRPGAVLITIHTYDGNAQRMYDFEEIEF